MIIATLSASFREGTNNSSFCTDWPFLTNDEQRKIAQLVVDLGAGTSLVGKNKPSHVYDDFGKIKGSDGYEECGYWHYHCGITWIPHTYKCHTIALRFNPDGMASDECIHYYKEDEDKIVIVGYSKQHSPFMLSDVPGNPFFD
ncbi:TPA: hypothetical protein ACYEOW_001175 [Raoultella terrigena]|jgi:hypothetical protein|uniref:hypothetical protein n=1 Tax=Raoultella ornithinolytica TaxID=54291 RepID=UPI001950F421|nr:hypothetical protein [Raoultella ornithinolytica]EKP1132995.1 hypothetical protein [Klebsiella michiganensis]MBM6478263.1 hypothetical protein [Raoultella ornithinolytica]MCF6685186.1 hypothetical protein [Raoultella ornithinolytica]MCF6708003.1 hypothetical protein [Raoultella ornithinolytica]MDE5426720.1 hypothetical protein [Raoultella ornithinolytica]